MATSGSKSVTVTSHDTLKFSWSRSSVDITNNKSTVTWKLELIADGYGKISSTTSKDWSVTVNGTKYSGTNTVSIANSATKTLASGSTVITHNSDGTKTFSYSFSQEFAITFSGSSIGTKSGSGSGTLDTIPRASSLTASNGTLGTAQTLSITRHSSSFTHTITYKCGTATGTITTKTTATSVSFTPPLSLASQVPNSTSTSVTLTLTTYNGSSSIGTYTKTINCSVPSSVVPTVSISVSDAAGYYSTYGAYIQSKSKIKYTVTESGAYGSTIKTRTVTADGSSYTALSATTGVIKGTGTLTITVKITDSRGRSSSKSTTISVLAYKVPSISSFSVVRSDSTGASSSSGAYLCVNFGATITSLNSKNKAAYTIKYKKTGTSTYTTATLTDYAGKYAVTGGKYVFAADTSSSYDVILTATDGFGSVTKSGVGATTSKVFSILAKGLGVAFGKVAELSNYLDVGFHARFRKDVQVDGNILGQIKKAFDGGKWIESRDRSLVRIPDYPDASHYSPIFSVKTTNGEWSGGIKNDNFVVSYTKDTDYTAGTNVSTKVIFYPDGTLNNDAKGHAKVLWSGGLYMHGTQTITLSESVSSQPHGIVLHWQGYTSPNPQNYWHQFIFVPKTHTNGGGVSMLLTNAVGDILAPKYVYVNNTTITGNALNDDGETAVSGSGITKTPNKFVLTEVLGV